MQIFKYLVLLALQKYNLVYPFAMAEKLTYQKIRMLRSLPPDNVKLRIAQINLNH